jgi:hypothetical protein
MVPAEAAETTTTTAPAAVAAPAPPPPVEAVAPAVAPVAAVEADAEADAMTATAEEPDHVAIFAELNDTLIPMSHPDNGSCDRYETDKAGNLLVPANEAAAMFVHGFAVVSTK